MTHNLHRDRSEEELGMEAFRILSWMQGIKFRQHMTDGKGKRKKR